jgi:drug/metabolite transporter (DMT)-like permease
MLGEIAAVGAVACWSWTAVFFTIASRSFGSWMVNVLRLLLGSCFLAATMLCLGASFSASSFQVLMLGLSGIIGLAIGDLLLFRSFVLMGPRLTMLVYTISPALTAVLAWVFLAETIGWLGLAGMAVTLAGIVWTLNEKRNGGSAMNRLAVVYTVIGALGQAGGLILAKSALNTGIPALPATFLRMAAASLVVVACSPFTSHGRRLPQVRKERKAFWALIGGAVFGPFLGVWLSQVAIKHTHTGIAATILSTTPIFLIPVSAWVEGERPTVKAVAGAVVAVTGVALLFLA